MTIVEQGAVEAAVPINAARGALGVSRASLYRNRGPRPVTAITTSKRAPSARRLSDGERQRILDTLHLPEFADQPPTEVYATLLGSGMYLASIRTTYRVLAAAGENRERRNQRRPQVHAMPSLTATAPNQAWTGDITKLATEQKGVFLLACVIIDLFSRYVVGWMLATKECRHLAAQLFAETIARNGIEPGLQVHADRGSAMKSDTLAQLLASLGASRSFSRPHVSDDNAFSEAQFKTMKYQPDYPGRFASELHGRGWLQDFFGWHNDEHHHSGLALFTPADVFHGRVELVRAVRQQALDAAFAADPERFPNGPPRSHCRQLRCTSTPSMPTPSLSWQRPPATGPHAVQPLVGSTVVAARRMRLSEGVNERLTRPPAPAASTRAPGLFVGSLIGFGVGAAGLAMGIGAGFVALDSQSELEARCPTKTCAAEDEQLKDDAELNATLSTVGFVLGGVGVALGITLVVIHQTQSAPSPTARIRALPGGIAFDASF